MVWWNWHPNRLAMWWTSSTPSASFQGYRNLPEPYAEKESPSIIALWAPSLHNSWQPISMAKTSAQSESLLWKIPQGFLAHHTTCNPPLLKQLRNRIRYNPICPKYLECSCPYFCRITTMNQQMVHCFFVRQMQRTPIHKHMSSFYLAYPLLEFSPIYQPT